MSPALRRLVLVAVSAPCIDWVLRKPLNPVRTMPQCGRCAGCEASRLATEIIRSGEMDREEETK